MKNKIKLLSLISALAIGATMTLTACGDNTVGEHDHVWGEPVITESTCHTEGKKTYSCEFEGCEQTKTEPIAKIAHSWNSGEVTKQAKCNEEGVKTYTCTAEGCEQTKTEPIEKTEHRYDDGQITRAPDFLINGIKTLTCLDCKYEKTQSVKAHADFSEQFYTALTESNNWLYGYANSYDVQTGTVDFARIEQAENGVWKSGKIEVGKGYVCGDNAAIAYRFTQEMPENIQTDVSISFSGEESTTRLNAYLIIDGVCVETIEKNTKDWSYATKEAIYIAQGDTFCIVFKNAGEGKAGGNLSLTFTPPCVHVWDSGKITKAATCTAEGVKTYTCVSCDEKITETVEMIPHKYNDGEVTLEPTETRDGVMTYTCEVCKGTKTEPIPQLGVKLANFAEDFELNERGEFTGWQLGVIDYHWSSETFDFTKISAHNENGDAYHSNDPWIDIKGDWMAVNGMMGFAYRFTSAANVKVQLNLHGVSEDGKFSLRWAIKDKDGNIKNADGKAQWYGDGHDIEFEQDITVVAGDVLYLLVNKDDGGDQNTFDLVLTADKQPEPEFEGANFAEDFELNESGEFAGWQLGVIDYHWSSETFDFAKISAHNENGDAYHSNDPWIDIKGDWMAVNGMMGFAYRFTSAANVKVQLNLHAVSDNGKFSLRWAIKDKDGNIKNTDGKAQWYGAGHDIEFNQDITVVAGDVLYLLVNKDEGGDQNTFDITLTNKEQQSVPEFGGANFEEDFSTENNPNGAWSYGYVNYQWGDKEDFTFVAAADHSGEGENVYGWKAVGENVNADIRSDLLIANKGLATIAYTFSECANVNVSFKFTGNGPEGNFDEQGKFNIRIGIKHSDGTIDNNPEFHSGEEVTVNKTIEFAAGDTIYFIIEHTDKGWDSGKPEITLTQAE